ncbi:MAG TPA: DUF3293 domain-containing protein, partial [Longimicrobium sp.]|nr:DUF3293 domain-containing protein [Longimicrobium sp.]
MCGPDEALRAAYLATTWSVRAPGGTLHLAPGRPAPRPLRPAAIVTAYNPASVRTSLAENRAAARRLLAQVADLGVPCLPARAHAPDLRWNEPGVALLGPASLAAAVRLGAEWGQNAILGVDGAGVISLVATRPG